MYGGPFPASDPGFISPEATLAGIGNPIDSPRSDPRATHGVSILPRFDPATPPDEPASIRKNLMKPQILTTLLTGATVLPCLAAPGTVLWSDNFDAPNNTNFDSVPVTGRLGGTLGVAPDVVARSSGIQQQILSNQLRLGGGRVRFQTSPSGGWYDWAGSLGEPNSTPAAVDAAAMMIADGGMQITFDWVPTDNVQTDWVNISLGFGTVGEPQRIDNIETDYGVLLRNNGLTQKFDNGIAVIAGAFPATETVRQVVYNFAFDSFADGATVRSLVTVDGVQVAADTFNWENNLGQLYFNLETNEPGTLIDNLTVSTVPVIYTTAIDDTEFISGIDPGQVVAAFSSETFAKGTEPSTYDLVAGTGDNDNGKFVFDGSELKAGAYDFTQDAGGTQYFIRVQGTGSVTGGTKVTEYVLTLIKDDDADGILDAWELAFTGNLTDLDGLANGPGPGAGTGDFDGDGYSDLEEFQLSLGAYATISPILADTDGDGLDDYEELNPTEPRLATNPLLFDTDNDGLSDKQETNTGTYVDAQDTGTNPLVADTDLDGARDGFEVEKGSIPTDFASRPALPPAFALVPITTDASSGISPDKTYTHAISGGGAATVNGVVFSVLNSVETPADFTWDTGLFTRNQINPINNGAWLPLEGGVTEPGLQGLLGGFSYSGNGDQAGRSQTFTLSGLTAGTTYELRLYLRAWSEATVRPIDFSFTNGAAPVEVPFGALILDRPGTVLNTDNFHSAYYLSFTYTAEASDLVIQAKVPDSAVGSSGSYHMYGMTHEVVPPPAGTLAITGVSRDGLGNLVIDFTGLPETTYNVTKSPDLTTTFGPLTTPLTATTNAAGVGQAIVPAEETSETREFYRIEDQ